MIALATYRMYAPLSLSFMSYDSIGRRWLAHVCVSASFAQALSIYFGFDLMDHNGQNLVRQTDNQAKFSLLLPSTNVSLLNVLRLEPMAYLYAQRSHSRFSCKHCGTMSPRWSDKVALNHNAATGLNIALLDAVGRYWHRERRSCIRRRCLVRLAMAYFVRIILQDDGFPCQYNLCRTCTTAKRTNSLLSAHSLCCSAGNADRSDLGISGW